jgi:GDP-L-fucose synthase
MTKKTIITGAHGFLGSHVRERFINAGYLEDDIFCPRSKDYDLTHIDRVQKLFRDFEAEQVVHIAADIGGIGYSKTHPGSQFYNNMLMNTLVLDEAYKAGVQKFVGIGTVCAYPKYTPVPFKEEDLWLGYPEETNAAYGLSKKMMMEQSVAYRQQYGFNAVHLLLINLYGPRDDFDLQDSHVIPALIRKLDEAKDRGSKEIIMWGDGSATREFLFVEDAADAIYLATERYNKPDPVNIGNGVEISIKELVSTVCEIMEFRGEVVWDTSKPNGQPRRRLDVSRAKNEFGFEAKVDLREGLARTIDWYLSDLKPTLSVPK